MNNQELKYENFPIKVKIIIKIYLSLYIADSYVHKEIPEELENAYKRLAELNYKEGFNPGISYDAKNPLSEQEKLEKENIVKKLGNKGFENTERRRILTSVCLRNTTKQLTIKSELYYKVVGNNREETINLGRDLPNLEIVQKEIEPYTEYWTEVIKKETTEEIIERTDNIETKKNETIIQQRTFLPNKIPGIIEGEYSREYSEEYYTFLTLARYYLAEGEKTLIKRENLEIFKEYYDKEKVRIEANQWPSPPSKELSEIRHKRISENDFRNIFYKLIRSEGNNPSNPGNVTYGPGITKAYFNTFLLIREYEEKLRTERQ